jgi:hypothetical protein
MAARNSRHTPASSLALTWNQRASAIALRSVALVNEGGPAGANTATVLLTSWDGMSVDASCVGGSRRRWPGRETT